MIPASQHFRAGRATGLRAARPGAILRGMKTLLSLGHGYCAQALARLLVPQGWRVIGTTRDPARARAMLADGVEPLIWPVPLAGAVQPCAAIHGAGRGR
jgi:hypothetical protein